MYHLSSLIKSMHVLTLMTRQGVQPVGNKYHFSPGPREKKNNRTQFLQNRPISFQNVQSLKSQNFLKLTRQPTIFLCQICVSQTLIQLLYRDVGKIGRTINIYVGYHETSNHLMIYTVEYPGKCSYIDLLLTKPKFFPKYTTSEYKKSKLKLKKNQSWYKLKRYFVHLVAR